MLTNEVGGRFAVILGTQCHTLVIDNASFKKIGII